jgi:hypothetical protein
MIIIANKREKRPGVNISQNSERLLRGRHFPNENHFPNEKCFPVWTYLQCWKCFLFGKRFPLGNISNLRHSQQTVAILAANNAFKKKCYCKYVACRALLWRRVFAFEIGASVKLHNCTNDSSHNYADLLNQKVKMINHL